MDSKNVNVGAFSPYTPPPKGVRMTKSAIEEERPIKLNEEKNKKKLEEEEFIINENEKKELEALEEELESMRSAYDLKMKRFAEIRSKKEEANANTSEDLTLDEEVYGEASFNLSIPNTNINTPITCTFVKKKKDTKPKSKPMKLKNIKDQSYLLNWFLNVRELISLESKESRKWKILEAAIPKDSTLYDQIQFDIKSSPEEQLEEIKKILGIQVNRVVLENLFTQLKYNENNDTIYGFSKKYTRLAKQAGHTNFNTLIMDFVKRLPTYYNYQYNKNIDEFDNLDFEETIELLIEFERRRNLKKEYIQDEKRNNDNKKRNDKDNSNGKSNFRKDSNAKVVSSKPMLMANSNPKSPAKSDSAPRGRGNSGDRGTPKGRGRGNPSSLPKSPFSNDANHSEKKDSNF